MKSATAAGATGACLALLFFTVHAQADAIKDCNSKDMDRRITGCTSALKTERFDKKSKAVAYSLRGEAYLVKQNDDAALADFEKCIELAPKENYCWSSKALIHSQRGELDQVISAYTVLMDLLQKGPQDNNAKAQMVLIAVDACEALTDRARERIAAAVGDVRQMMLPPNADRKGVENAIADLTASLRFCPDDPEVLGTRALYSSLLGRRDEAIADAQTAYKEDPKNAEALAVLAISAFEDKDYSRSLEMSQLWYKHASGNEIAEEQLGKALSAVGRKEEADALATLSANRRTCYALTSEVRDGKQASLDDGIAACSRVIEAPGVDASTLLAPYEFRGFLRGHKGDLEGSAADYTRCIEISGGAGRFATFYTQRGNKLVALKKLDLAIADFDAALKQMPEEASTLAERGFAYVELGQYDKAKSDFARLKQLNPNDANAYAGLGDVAQKTSSFTEAVTYFAKLIELRADFALGYLYRAFCLEQLGKKEEAIADYRKALSLDPALAQSAEGLKRLGAAP